MTIEIVIGPYRSGKTKRLLQEFVASKKEYPLDHCLLLVPSHRYGRLLFQQLTDCIQEFSDNTSTLDSAPNRSTGIFGVQIATIYEACEQILQAAGKFSTIVPPNTCTAIMRKAIDNLQRRGELAHLSAIAEFPGTASSVLRLIDEMERAALTPSEVIATINNTASSSSRHIELAKLYKEYWLQLEELECSDQKRLAFSCRELLASKHTSGLHLRWLLIDGFDRISPLQAEIMHGLAQHASHTRIAFDYILPEQRVVNVADYDASLDDYSWKESSFAELTSRFLAPPVVVSAPPKEVAATQVAFQSLDRFLEMEEVARRCKQTLIKHETEPSQILIIARDITQYAPAARAAFESAGLPHYIDEAVEFLSLPVMKTFWQLLRLHNEDFARPAVLEFLRAKNLNHHRLNLTLAQIEALDKKSFEAGIVNGIQTWFDYLQDTVSTDITTALRQFFQRVTPVDQASTSYYCQWVEDLLADMFLSNNDRDQLEALQGMRTALRELLVQTQLFNSPNITYDQFLSDLHSLIKQATFRRPPRSADTILISSAEQAPNKRFDAVFVVGVNEGHFPKHTGQSGFVSSDERSRWCSFGINIANPREHAGFEHALFRSLIERARKNICFSFPQVDLSGDELVPSFYLTDGTTNIKQVPKLDSAQSALTAPISARNAIGSWLWLKPGLELAPILEAEPIINNYWQSLAPPLFGAYSRHQDGSRNVHNGYLTDLISSEWLNISLPTTWSASSFNLYGECPFKFWITKLLRMEPRNDPEPGLSVQTKGRLYHKALELYYSRLYAHGSSAETSTLPYNIPEPSKSTDAQCNDSEPIYQQQLQAAFDDAIKSFEDDVEFRPGQYWQNERDDMLFRLQRFIKYDRQRMDKDKVAYTPHLFESRFGFKYGNSAPPLVIDTEHGPITIRGVIDRVDVSQQPSGTVNATIIDYKTGSTPVSMDDTRRGANIQLPLYALAVQQAILPGSKVVHGHYLGIGPAKSNGSIDFTSEKLTDLLDGTIVHIRNTIDGITNGDFSVNPYSTKACQRCDHRTACRIIDLKNANEEDN